MHRQHPLGQCRPVTQIHTHAKYPPDSWEASRNTVPVRIALVQLMLKQDGLWSSLLYKHLSLKTKRKSRQQLGKPNSHLITRFNRAVKWSKKCQRSDGKIKRRENNSKLAGSRQLILSYLFSKASSESEFWWNENTVQTHVYECFLCVAR